MKRIVSPLLALGCILGASRGAVCSEPPAVGPQANQREPKSDRPASGKDQAALMISAKRIRITYSLEKGAPAWLKTLRLPPNIHIRSEDIEVIQSQHDGPEAEIALVGDVLLRSGAIALRADRLVIKETGMVLEGDAEAEAHVIIDSKTHLVARRIMLHFPSGRLTVEGAPVLGSNPD